MESPAALWGPVPAVLPNKRTSRVLGRSCDIVDGTSDAVRLTRPKLFFVRVDALLQIKSMRMSLAG